MIHIEIKQLLVSEDSAPRVIKTILPKKRTETEKGKSKMISGCFFSVLELKRITAQEGMGIREIDTPVRCRKAKMEQQPKLT